MNRDQDHPLVRSFASVDEAFAFMRANTDAANERLSTEQKGIDWGDYFMSYSNDFGLLIFAQVMPLEEILSEEERLGAEPAELEYTRGMRERSHADGYRFGMHYSVVEPSGEMGSTHIFQCWPISEADYRLAESVRWDLDDVVDSAKLAGLYRALMALREHWRQHGIVMRLAQP